MGALIANPEVLCIHRPTRAFDADTPEFRNTLNLLRSFVDEKGVAQNPETKNMRRPRTCIMTAGKRVMSRDATHFDAVFEVMGDKVEERIRRESSHVAAN